MSDDKFYNPYQFIAASGIRNGKESVTIDCNEVLQGKTDIRHDRWLQDMYSGQIVGSITTISPLFIGGCSTTKNESDGEQAQILQPYMASIGNRKLPAIPGNSFRGGIASYMEALSQSTLRVLEDRSLSVRKSMPRKNQPPGTEGPLSGIGIITAGSENAPEGAYGLLPLCVTGGFRRANQGFEKNEDCWAELFYDRTLSQSLPVYLSGYDKRNHQERFLKKDNPDAYPYPNNQYFYYAKLNPLLDEIKVGSEFGWNKALEDALVVLGNEGPVLAQQPLLKNELTQEPDIITPVEYRDLSEDEQSQYTRGILRVLDMDNFADVIPKNKNKEFFIPYPEDLQVEILPIPGAVLDTYDMLREESEQADEKKQDDERKRLPVRLKGYPDTRVAVDRIFFFAVEGKEKEPDNEPEQEAKTAEDFGGLKAMLAHAVEKHDQNNNEPPPRKEYEFILSEISTSSLWRKKLPDTVYDFFPEHLTPWRDQDQQEKARKLTPAEALFGFVSDGKAAEGSSSARALAGRLRFCDAVPVTIMEESQYFMPRETLKILSSPKPPAPAMYFHPEVGREQYIDKTTLSKTEHKPNGYKYYLHHPNACAPASDAKPWATQYPNENLKQKVSIRPLKQNIDFQFTIHFENLSAAELDWLLTALHPGSGHYHHLGMGKPFGLGSVQLRVGGVYLCDHKKRYQVSQLSQPRYQTVWINDRYKCLQYLPDYSTEKQKHIDFMSAWDILKSDISEQDSLIDQPSFHALQQLMTPGNLQADIPIHYPLAKNQEEESEGFQWFVNNAAADYRQALGTINADGIQPMRRNSSKRKKND